MGDKKLRALILLCASAVFVISGWFCDDAYHGFVMSKHLVEGNGLVYNIGERVNASTCPLFTLIIAAVYWPFRNGMYILAMMTCVLFSAACIWLMIYRICRDKTDLMFLSLLMCSKSFISYTTSGLENPLLFLLGILLFLTLFRSDAFHEYGGSARELFLLSFLSGLIALARMDNILIYLPTLIYIFFIRQNKPGRLKTIFIGIAGVLPFVAWEFFSLFYYGFLFPNTAYIKLNTGITSLQYVMKGLQYVIYSALADPAVVIFPVIYCVMAFCASQDIRNKLLSAGILLYIAYVIRIGGDFMGGRHFTVIYILSAAGLISLREKINLRAMLKVSLACLMFAATVSINAFGYYGTYVGTVTDERFFYFRNTSLLRNTISYLKEGKLCIYGEHEKHNNRLDEIRKAGLKGDIIGAPGIRVYKNSDLYLADKHGLGDPLLSHLPSVPVKGMKWRAGHIWREIPEGYRESIQNGTNEIVNPSLHKYYDVIRLITRGELFSRERIQAIIDINLGRYDYLVAQYLHDTQENKSE